MTDGGYTMTEAWNLQLQAQVEALTAALRQAEGALGKIRPSLGYGYGPVRGETLGETPAMTQEEVRAAIKRAVTEIKRMNKEIVELRLRRPVSIHRDYAAEDREDAERQRVHALLADLERAAARPTAPASGMSAGDIAALQSKLDANRVADSGAWTEAFEPASTPQPAQEAQVNRYVEAARERIAFLRAAEAGGCFLPDDESQDGECADGACFCARQVDKMAEAVVARIIRTLRTDQGAVDAICSVWLPHMKMGDICKAQIEALCKHLERSDVGDL